MVYRRPPSAVVRHRPPSSTVVNSRSPSPTIFRHRPPSSVSFHRRLPQSAVVCRLPPSPTVSNRCKPLSAAVHTCPSPLLPNSVNRCCSGRLRHRRCPLPRCRCSCSGLHAAAAACRRSERLTAAPGAPNMPRPRTARYPIFTQGVENMLRRQLVHPDHRTGRTGHHLVVNLGDPCSPVRSFRWGSLRERTRGATVP